MHFFLNVFISILHLYMFQAASAHHQEVVCINTPSGTTYCSTVYSRPARQSPARGGGFSDFNEWRENKLSAGGAKVGLMYCLQDLQLRWSVSVGLIYFLQDLQLRWSVKLGLMYCMLDLQVRWPVNVGLIYCLQDLQERWQSWLSFDILPTGSTAEVIIWVRVDVLPAGSTGEVTS